MTDQDQRRCTACGDTKPLTEFHRRANGDGREGRHSQCKVCKCLSSRMRKPLRYCIDCHAELVRGDRHVRCGICRDKRLREQHKADKERFAAGPKAKRQNECKTCDFLHDCQALLSGPALPYCFPASPFHHAYKAHNGHGKKLQPLTAEFLLTLEAG